MGQSALSLLPVDDAATRAAARRVIGEYLSWVAGVAATRHGLVFDAAALLGDDFGGTTRFHLLCQGGMPVGVGGLKQRAPGLAEVRRLYVQPACRGLGGGRLLLDRLLADARAAGIARVRLESLRSLTAAHALYRAAGFAEVAPHQDALPQTCLAGVVFMELALRA